MDIHDDEGVQETVDVGDHLQFGDSTARSPCLKLH